VVNISLRCPPFFGRSRDTDGTQPTRVFRCQGRYSLRSSWETGVLENQF
jgi:hypothetical protein